MALLLAAASTVVRGNSFTPPIQLHPCSTGAASQRWSFGHNGSIYSLDDAGTRGYCLDVARGQGGVYDMKVGAAIMGADCGNTTSMGTSLWVVRGSTVASMQPGTPFCLGIPPTNKNGGWDPMSVAQRAQLTNCSAPAAQFHVVNATAATTSSRRHRSSSAAAAASPTACKVSSTGVACYITKGGGPCSPCPGPSALPVPAPTPSGLQMSWELCARYVHFCMAVTPHTAIHTPPRYSTRIVHRYY